MSWLVDNANVFYFLFGAVAFCYLAAGWTTRRVKFWAYAAAAGGMILLVWLLTILVVTDRKRIDLDLEAMAQATERHDPDAIFEHVSKNFHYRSLDRDELYRRVSGSVKANKVSQVRLTGKDVVVKGQTAEAVFNFHVDTKEGQSLPATAKAKFVREDGEWRMIELEVYTLGTTNPLRIPGID